MVLHQKSHHPATSHHHTCNPSTDVIIGKPFCSENRFHCTVAYSKVRAPTLLAQVTLVAEENWKLPSIEFIVSWVDFLLVVESVFSSIQDHSKVCDILISGFPPRTRSSPVPFPSSRSHISPCLSILLASSVCWGWVHLRKIHNDKCVFSTKTATRSILSKIRPTFAWISNQISRLLMNWNGQIRNQHFFRKSNWDREKTRLFVALLPN